MRVVIAEKTEAGEAIARILSGGLYEVVDVRGVRCFSFDDTIVVPARGHLIDWKMRFPRGVALDDLPVTNMVLDVAPTMPTTKVDRELRKQNRERLEVIGELIEGADEVVVGTDWDREGEVIGYRILEWFGRAKGPYDVERAYFSALAPEFVERAFRETEPMSEALLTQGLARGIADVIIGLNLTKALTLIFKERYPQLGKAINTGRVRSPLLAHVVRTTHVRFREKGNMSSWPEKSEKCYIRAEQGWVSVPELSDFREGPIYLADVVEEEEERPQASLLPNTDDIMTALDIKPDVLMNQILEPMYLAGLITYPRTKNRFCVYPEFLRECESVMKERGFIPDSFSADFSPAIDLKSEEYLSVPEEEKKKLPLMLTPKGIVALAEERMSKAEEFVARWLLAQMARSMAPPLRMVKVYYVFKQDEREVEVLWREDVKNPEDAVKWLRLERRPELSLGEYELVRFEEVSEYAYTSEAFRPEVTRWSDTDMVRWMVDVRIGTPATRHGYPEILRRTGFLNDANLPTRLGTVVADILERIGLDTRLTAEMEERIDGLKKLDDLDWFKDWVVEKTASFIRRLINIRYDIDIGAFFCCPQGHETELIWRRGKLFGVCHTCDKVYIMG